MSEYNNILYSVTDDVATITLNRPKSLNSLDLASVDELLDAIGRIRTENVRCLIMTGSGRGFCVGADLASYLGDRLKTARPGEVDLGPPMLDYYNAVVNKLKEVEVPVITAVNGMAAGGGCSIALLGDIVIASSAACFTLGFSKIGLMPDMGATWLLPRVMGMPKAKAIAFIDNAGDMLNGAGISAAQAEAWGMIWSVVAPEQLLEHAQGIARGIASQQREVLVATKKALNASYQNDFRSQLLLEMESQRALGMTQAFHDGVLAFLSKASG